MMVKNIFVLLICIICDLAFADSQKYVFDPLHTSVRWRISHFGFSSPSGSWIVESGMVMLDEKNLSNSKVVATIQIDDLNTGIPSLDEHLYSKQFFDVADFPEVTFVSTKVRKITNNKLLVTGNLTLHGVTRPVTLNVIINKIGIHPITMHKTAGFSATTRIKRSDFGMTAYLPGLGDNVDLSIEAEAGMVTESAAK